MDVSTIIMLVVLLFLVVLMVLSHLRRKKFTDKLMQMRSELKIGDKVMTDTGVVGEVVDKRVDGEFNFVTIKTGTENHVGYMEIHENAVYYTFNKEGEPEYAGQNLEDAEETKSVETKPAETTSVETKEDK